MGCRRLRVSTRNASTMAGMTPAALATGTNDTNQTPPEMVIDALLGRLQRQARFPHTAWPGQRDQPRGRAGEQPAQLNQLFCAAQKLVERGSQVVARTVQRGLDLCRQRDCLIGWFGVENLAHDAAATLVSCHRRAAATRAGQRQHELAMGLFAPGIQGEQARGAVDGRGKVAFHHLAIDEIVERIERHFTIACALRDDPIFEVSRVAEQHAFEEVPMIERHGGCKLCHACCRWCLLPGLNPVHEFIDIQDDRRVAGQGDRLARDLQLGVEELAQVGEHLAQVVLGVGFAHLAPEQRRQRLALDAVAWPRPDRPSRAGALLEMKALTGAPP